MLRPKVTQPFLKENSFSVPPRIVNRDDDTDLVVREGENMTLTCDAKGHPKPQIVWRREDSEDIMVEGRKGKIILRPRVHVVKRKVAKCFFILSTRVSSFFFSLFNSIKWLIRFLFFFPASIVESRVLRIPKISRLHMGDYLCVASNGIAPSTSKKYRIRVQCESFTPFIHISLLSVW